MILVTAATGQVGRELVPVLRSRGLAFRALVRGAALEGVVECVRGDFRDTASLAAAMAGVERMYLACAPTPDQADLEMRAIDAAARNGVRHVVKLSAYDAHDANPSDFRRWNGVAERHLRNSGLAWTILRPTAFNQSLDPRAVVERGVLRSPQGAATTPFVDTRDIADVAAAVLGGTGHDGRIYDLTGPEAFTQPALAALIAEVFVTPVACRPVSDAEALRELLQSGMDEVFARSMIVHWQSYRARPATLVSGWTEILTGQSPRTLRAYLEECRAAAPVGAPAAS